MTASIGNVAGVAAPTFAVCASASKATCNVGSLQTGQSEELLAGSAVGSSAAAGAQITLTATVKATTGSSFAAHATITVASTASGSSSSDFSDLPSFELPGTSLPGLPNGAFTMPTNPSGLFPTVSPTSSGNGRSKDKNHKATTDSAILPLSSRLIGGQLAGLAVLATAIAIAVVRLSLRGRPRDSGPGQTGPDAPPTA